MIIVSLFSYFLGNTNGFLPEGSENIHKCQKILALISNLSFCVKSFKYDVPLLKKYGYTFTLKKSDETDSFVKKNLNAYFVQSDLNFSWSTRDLDVNNDTTYISRSSESAFP